MLLQYIAFFSVTAAIYISPYLNFTYCSCLDSFCAPTQIIFNHIMIYITGFLLQYIFRAHPLISMYIKVPEPIAIMLIDLYLILLARILPTFDLQSVTPHIHH